MISSTFELHKLIYRLDIIASQLLKKKFKLTFSEFLVIQAITDLKNPTQQQVAIWSNLSKGMISRIITELVKKSIVSKSYSSKDKRSATLTLTKKGNLISSESSILVEDRFNKIAKESISQKEKAELIKTIIKLNKATNNYI